MIVVVEESSHEQAAAMFSSSLSQTNGPRICLLQVAFDVQMSRASKQVKYVILAMSLQLILQAMPCVAFTVSSRLSQW